MQHTQSVPTRRVLVVRPGALGDALLTFPTLATLRRAWPDARITLVSRAAVLSLAATSGLAEGTSDFASTLWSALFLPPSTQSSAVHALREALAGTTHALAWVGEDEHTVASNLRLAGIDTVVVAPGRPTSHSAQHAAQQLASALAQLGIAPPASDAALVTELPVVATPTADEACASQTWSELGLTASAGGIVALHAGSGGASKRWTPTGFASVASGLAASGYQPVLVEGPQDEALTAEIQRGVRLRDDPAHLPVVREVSVSTLAAVLRRCAAYLGNDSGVSHLAGLLGIPTLALFGPTDSSIWRPLGRRVSILQSPTDRLEDLAAADVLSTVLGMLRRST